jgi:hypothetical protein
MAIEAIATWSGRGELTEWPEMDYAVMTPENGWELIYEPPEVLMPNAWIRRRMKDTHDADDSDNAGFNVEHAAFVSDAAVSRLLSRFRIGPRRLAASLNILFQNGPLDVKATGLPQSLAVKIRNTFYVRVPRTIRLAEKKRRHLKRDGVFFKNVWEPKPLANMQLIDRAFLEYCASYGVELWRLGIDPDSVKARLEKRSPCKLGSDNRASKLTEDLIREIRFRHRRKLGSFGRMAKDYGVTSATISQIVHGDTWKHVKNEPPEWFTSADYAEREQRLKSFQTGGRR